MPRFTVIIPMRKFHADEPVLASLRETPPPDGMAQVLVAEGEHPSRQRNTGFAHAQGEIIVFLDNDCRIAPDYWTQLESTLAKPEVEIVGGPALLRPGATSRERIFHALLTHTLLVGTVSARYAPRGAFRKANQTDLILCNLAVRKAIFEKIGPLSTDLYPNEENEWLDRAQDTGVGIYYQPTLQVVRPQRQTWTGMAVMLLRYGMGRTRQFMVSGWHPTFHQFLPLMMVGAFGALFYWGLEEPFALLWLLAAAIIAATCAGPLSLRERIVAGLAAPFLPLYYSVGQLAGWFALLFPAPAVEAGIALVNERGEPVP